MKIKPRFLLFIFCAFFLGRAQAQIDLSKICRLENDKLYFKLDLHWSDAEKKEVARLFDLDSLLLQKAFAGAPFVKMEDGTWEVHNLGAGIIEISKFLAPSPPVFTPSSKDVMLIDFNWPELTNAYQQVTVTFGVNKLVNGKVFSYKDNMGLFFLPGFQDARKVILSGSFNDWSTIQLQMTKSDTGWTIAVPLSPGRYGYKYIIDGKWKQDPNNKLEEDDTHGGHNSVVFCENYLFRLKGYKDAKTVILAGSFNEWRERELKMNPTAEGWELPVFLKQGTYAYKFIVDRNWITDPANPITRPDGYGNLNSFLGIGDTLVFRLNGYRNAHKVALAGSFNNWDGSELMMERDSAGWYLPYVLAKGNYEYKFIVDGNWMPDPQNPYSSGSGDQDNSFIAFKPNHTFVLDTLLNARTVIVTGLFNNWDHGKYRMKKENGKWVFPVYLQPGKNLYKFIVDGVWILDPRNELWEENEYGTRNSLIWIEP